MYAEIATALASIKTASELAGLVLKSKVDAAVTQKAIELQSAIISLQTAIMSFQSQNHELLEENNRLKQKLIDIENWEATAQKYSLKPIAPSVFVYALNQDQFGTQPEHWLCAQCYENKKKSILQRGKFTYEGYVYSCGNCKAEILDHSHPGISIG